MTQSLVSDLGAAPARREAVTGNLLLVNKLFAMEHPVLREALPGCSFWEKAI